MERHRRLLGIVATVLLAAALLSAGSRSWQLQRTPDNLHHPIHTAFCDFQDVVYYPARAAFAGVNPYDSRPTGAGGQYFARFPAGNSFPLYAPLIFIGALPFAVLDLTTAEILYSLFNVGLLLLYGYVLLKIAGQTSEWSYVVALSAVLLISRPGNANFYFGAITLPMVLATLGSWWLAERRPWISGVLLALACIKPTFGGPLFVLLLLRGCYRAAFAGLGLAVIANLAVVAVLLPQLLNSTQLADLITINQAATEANEAVDPLRSGSRLDLPMVVERLAGQHLPGVVRYGMTFAILTITGLGVRQLERLKDADRRAVDFESLALVSLTITLCIYHNIYDALLIAPAALVALANARKRTSENQGRLGWLLFALFMVPAVNYATSQKVVEFLAWSLPPLAALIQHPALWTVLCLLNAVCLAVAWGILLANCFRRNEARPAHASK